jgi:hypothetical protein
MKNELEEICRLLRSTDVVAAAEIKQQLPEIEKKITEQFLGCKGENEKNRFAAVHQSAATELLDTLSNKEGEQKDVQQLFENCTLLLHFLRSLFHQHWNYQLPVPVGFRIRNISCTNKLVKQAKEKFAIENMETKLLRTIVRPLQEFITGATVCSWQRFIDMYHYQKRLKKMLCADTLTMEVVLQFLLVSEFSQAAFLSYYVGAIENSRPASSSANESLQYYWLQLKKAEQLVIVPHVMNSRYATQNIALIRQWLQVEITYLKRQKKSIAGPVNKIAIKYSVAELSIGVRLLYDARIFKNKSLAELMRLVSETFITANSDDISPGSLNKKAYACERSSIASICNEMKGLLALIKKY